LHDYSGTALLSIVTPFQIIVSTTGPSQGAALAYANITRGFMTFPVSLPTGAIVTNCVLHLYNFSDSYTFPGTQTVSAGYYNNASSYGLSDFYNCKDIGGLSTVNIWAEGTWKDITVDATRISNGYAQIVIREGNYDYPNIAPPMTDSKTSRGFFYNGDPSTTPYLEVTYSTIPSPKLVGSNLNGGAYRVSRRLL